MGIVAAVGILAVLVLKQGSGDTLESVQVWMCIRTAVLVHVCCWCSAALGIRRLGGRKGVCVCARAYPCMHAQACAARACARALNCQGR